MAAPRIVGSASAPTNDSGGTISGVSASTISSALQLMVLRIAAATSARMGTCRIKRVSMSPPALEGEVEPQRPEARCRLAEEVEAVEVRLSPAADFGIEA